jgi:hypothetical protein
MKINIKFIRAFYEELQRIIFINIKASRNKNTIL